MQQLIVILIVAAAGAYVLWAFMPQRWRRALAARLGLSTDRVGGGCHSSCDDCGGCAPKPLQSDKKQV